MHTDYRNKQTVQISVIILANAVLQCQQESLANAKVSMRQPSTSKADFDMKYTLKVILGHSLCYQL